MSADERRASGAPSESTGQTTTDSVEERCAPGGEPIPVRGRQFDAVASQGGSHAAQHLGDYLEAVFGDAEGTAFVAVGSEPYAEGGRYKHRGWKETSFAWPSEAASLRRAVTRGVYNGADVYVCPYLMQGTKRAKGDAVERTKIHADIDGLLMLERIEDLGGYAVASGTPGHGHVYVDLDQDVPASWHEALCRGLGVFMGHADAKVCDNDVLRPPGTVNNSRWPSGPGPPRLLSGLCAPLADAGTPRCLPRPLV